MVRVRVGEHLCVPGGEALLDGIDGLRRNVGVEFAVVELNRHFDVVGLIELSLYTIAIVSDRNIERTFRCRQIRQLATEAKSHDCAGSAR